MGGEFLGREMEDILTAKNIHHYIGTSASKSIFSERFIRFAKGRLYRIMTGKKTNNWVQYLDQVIQNYNNTTNRYGFSPSSVTVINSPKIWDKLYSKDAAEFRKFIRKKQKSYPVGTKVHIAEVQTPFRKGFKRKFSKEVYTIQNVLNTVPTSYRLKNSKNEILRKLYYKYELFVAEVNQTSVN
jgi:hypothetical protein